MTQPDAADFDLALSFAGDHRNYVAQVAEGLRQRGFNVFYDEFLRTELLGQELLRYLQEVYSVRSRAVAAFISEEWVTRPYTTHERETALAHALLTLGRGEAPFLLPYRFDDTPVPGLQPTVAYDDLRRLHPGERRWRKDPRYRHPVFVVEDLKKILLARGVVPAANRESGVIDGEVGVRALVVWVNGGQRRDAVGLVPELDFEEGATEIFSDERDDDGPPAGRYLLVPERIGVAVNPNEPMPIFLQDTHEAHEKSWLQPYEDPEEEAAAADVAKRRIQKAVDLEISTGAVPIGPTFTRTIETPGGLAIYGICVLAQRAKKRSSKK